VDVIEAGYRQLHARVEAAGDYSAAVAAHDAFVDGVLAAAFLDVRNLQVGCSAAPHTFQLLCPVLEPLAQAHGLKGGTCFERSGGYCADLHLPHVAVPDLRTIAVLQATLMALFSLCRRLCARLHVRLNPNFQR
jgi:hypothetical protein